MTLIFMSHYWSIVVVIFLDKIDKEFIFSRCWLNHYSISENQGLASGAVSLSKPSFRPFLTSPSFSTFNLVLYHPAISFRLVVLRTGPLSTETGRIRACRIITTKKQTHFLLLLKAKISTRNFIIKFTSKI